MKELIEEIQIILSDYRQDENDESVRITTDNILDWINQFDPAIQLQILTELKNIFDKRYLSKNRVKRFLEITIEKLTKDFKYTDPLDFLNNCNFLNLQSTGKSQDVMLSLLNEVIIEKYQISLENCGLISHKYSVYIDDILCTGLTLINNITDWSSEEFNSGKTNLMAVNDGSTILVFAYVFIHDKNYYKKVAEMRFKISKDFAAKHKMYRLLGVDNNYNATSKIDFVFPIANLAYQDVIDYKDEIVFDVDIYTQKYNNVSIEEFYRPVGLPQTEMFFTDSTNRVVLEDAFLRKGIQILKTSNPANKNIRALGYSIPSLKNFGFGALCFTWRNVPNNAPLVFWYAGGGFRPLFKVTRR